MKSSQELTIKELNECIEERKRRLKELEEQDETNFSEWDKSIKGKEVNMMLVRNHIIFYTRILEQKQKGSLLNYI